MPGADQQFWGKREKNREKGNNPPNFPMARAESPQTFRGRRSSRSQPAPGSGSTGTDFSRVHLKLFGIFFFVAASTIGAALNKKKNRYSSLINATLNYNTMMSAVLIKHWLGYKKTPRRSKSR